MEDTSTIQAKVVTPAIGNLFAVRFDPKAKVSESLLGWDKKGKEIWSVINHPVRQ